MRCALHKALVKFVRSLSRNFSFNPLQFLGVTRVALRAPATEPSQPLSRAAAVRAAAAAREVARVTAAAEAAAHARRSAPPLPSADAAPGGGGGGGVPRLRAPLMAATARGEEARAPPRVPSFASFGDGSLGSLLNAFAPPQQHASKRDDPRVGMHGSESVFGGSPDDGEVTGGRFGKVPRFA